jgi:cellulose synthase/poly-beta-1,6-N-acetylglucosamine synthase-like glycosyltransferase
MHKIHKTTNWKIRFAFEQKAVNYTHPEPNFKQFLNQRTRWASKSTHYSNKNVTLILGLVYFFYLYLFLGIIYSVFFNFIILPFLLYLGKWLMELIVIIKGIKVVSKKELLKYFPIAQLFQIFYILIVGIRGIFGKYDWKGRQTQNYLGFNQSPKK